MKVLIACEFSGTVRDAFIRHGHDAVSCDLLPSETLGPHIQGDVLKALGDGWDLVIAHPPCTHLASSGARWFSEKQKDGRQRGGVDFFMEFVNCPVPRVAIENPVGIMSTLFRKPDQIIQPWQYGHGETKKTCLWLRGLLHLRPTNVVDGREPRIHKMSPSPDRWKQRSITCSGIAEAMASQWGRQNGHAAPP
jgi:hypothetical protein